MQGLLFCLIHRLSTRYLCELVIFGWWGGVPYFGLQGELSTPKRQHFWVTACGTWARASQKPRRQLRFRDEVDARISPPVDEYYIIQYEGATVDMRDQR